MTRRRHIGIDARLTYYRDGGISRYIRNLIHELERLNPPHDYTIFHSRKAEATLSEQFDRANLWTPCHHRIERTALTVEYTRFGLDVLHSPDFIPPYRGAKRHVITVHDLSFLHYPEYMTADSRRYYVDQIHAATKNADHILTISEASKQDIMAQLGVPASNITVHLMGVDASFQPQTQLDLRAARTTLELPDDYLLFVGTFEPRKNISGLLHGYAQLRTTLPDAPPLVIAGRSGWLFAETMQEIDALNLGDAVLWRQNIPADLLPALYGGAIALVTPSFYEGFGLPALEAMACGTVPVVSNVSSLPEVVGDVGLLVDPHDPNTICAAMERVFTDQHWRQQQEQLAIERAAGFTWAKTARIAQSVYEKVTE